MPKALFDHTNVDLSELPDAVRERILTVQEKAGFVPNVFLALARRPAEFRAFFDYHDALMKRDSDTLPVADREMIVVAMSALNRCQYCVVAHGALLRVYAKDPLLADRVAVNFRKTELSERQRAMLEYAEKLSFQSDEVDDEDHAMLLDVGFTADDVWDITAITAFFGMSNRLANGLGMLPNPEFFSLGR
ncbi:MAG: peroxidase-related enzyme [Pseudomonadota bacterium]